MSDELIENIIEKKLGIHTISRTKSFKGEEKDWPYKVKFNNLQLSEEIIKLMDVYNITVEDAIITGVKFIVKSILKKDLEEEQ